MDRWPAHTLMAALDVDGKIRLDASKCMRCGNIITHIDRWDGQFPHLVKDSDGS